MRKISKLTVAILIGIFWLVMSLIGYCLKNTVYRDYETDAFTTPYFVMVLQGISEGVFPWSGEDGNGTIAGLFGMGKNDSTVSVSELENDSQISGENGGKTNLTTSVINSDTDNSTQSEGKEGLSGDPEDGGSSENNADNTDSSENDGGNNENDDNNATETTAPDTYELEPVDDGYFDDALFIGDSRTVGLGMYTKMSATFFASTGLNVYNIWERKFCEVDGAKLSLEEALLLKQYPKIYFSLGINELGWGSTDYFMDAYIGALSKIMEMQPDAKIFVQGIMHITKAREDNTFSNAKINTRNEAIAALNNSINIFYLDPNEVFSDAEGNLFSDFSHDGIHLYASKYVIWQDYLRNHGVLTPEWRKAMEERMEAARLAEEEAEASGEAGE